VIQRRAHRAAGVYPASEDRHSRSFMTTCASIMMGVAPNNIRILRCFHSGTMASNAVVTPRSFGGASCARENNGKVASTLREKTDFGTFAPRVSPRAIYQQGGLSAAPRSWPFRLDVLVIGIASWPCVSSMTTPPGPSDARCRIHPAIAHASISFPWRPARRKTLSAPCEPAMSKPM